MRHDEPATMMHLIKPLLLLMGVLLLLFVSEQVAGDSLRIFDVAGSDGPEIKLSQVAELEGEYANRFADVVVGRFEDGEPRYELKAAAILTAIRNQGAKLGLLDLNGFTRCTVHRTFTGQAQAQTSPSEPAAVNIDAPTVGEPITLHTPMTVRALIKRDIARQAGVDESSLQVSFTNRKDGILEESAVAGRYEVELVSGSGLGKVRYRVIGFRGTQQVGEPRVVDAHVQQRIIAVVVVQQVGRGDLIGRRQVRLSEVLIDDPSQQYVTETSLVTGLVANRALQAGKPILADDIKQPIAVRRRQRVSVELLSRGLKITFNGIAQEEGAVSDQIEVENPHTKERFTATVVGRGKVVAGEHTDQTTKGSR